MSMAFGTAMLVKDSVVFGANPGRNRRTDRHVRKEEATGEKLGGNRFAAGQVGRGEHGTDGQRQYRVDLGYRLVENIFGRLFFGNFGLGGVGNLVAATGARRDFAVGQQQFTKVQTNSSARPEDGVANAIRKINFAGFSGAHQTGVAVIEVGVMAANYIVAQRRIAKIVGIFHASRHHRVGINIRDPREKLRGPGGAHRHEREILADVPPRPKGVGQYLGSMQGGEREIAGGILPAGASEGRPDDHNGQGALKAETTPVPTPPSSHGFSDRTVVQNSTPARRRASGRQRESQL